MKFYLIYNHTTLGLSAYSVTFFLLLAVVRSISLKGTDYQFEMKLPGVVQTLGMFSSSSLKKDLNRVFRRSKSQNGSGKRNSEQFTSGVIFRT